MKLYEYYFNMAKRSYNTAKEFSKDDPRYDEFRRIFQKNMEICNKINTLEYWDIVFDRDETYSQMESLEKVLEMTEVSSDEEINILRRMYDSANEKYKELLDKEKAYREKMEID